MIADGAQCSHPVASSSGHGEYFPGCLNGPTTQRTSRDKNKREGEREEAPRRKNKRRESCRKNRLNESMSSCVITFSRSLHKIANPTLVTELLYMSMSRIGTLPNKSTFRLINADVTYLMHHDQHPLHQLRKIHSSVELSYHILRALRSGLFFPTSLQHKSARFGMKNTLWNLGNACQGTGKNAGLNKG